MNYLLTVSLLFQYCWKPFGVYGRNCQYFQPYRLRPWGLIIASNIDDQVWNTLRICSDPLSALICVVFFFCLYGRPSLQWLPKNVRHDIDSDWSRSERCALLVSSIFLLSRGNINTSTNYVQTWGCGTVAANRHYQLRRKLYHNVFLWYWNTRGLVLPL